MSEKKTYFTAENVQSVSVRASSTSAGRFIEQRREPRTEIGREALRSFTVDFEAIDRAFTRAMRRNG